MAGILLVRDAMTTNVKTVTPDSSLVEVIQKMNKFEIGSVVVVQRKRPVGIITERDILRKIIEPWVDPTIVKAKEIMSSPTRRIPAIYPPTFTIAPSKISKQSFGT